MPYTSDDYIFVLSRLVCIYLCVDILKIFLYQPSKYRSLLTCFLTERALTLQAKKHFRSFNNKDLPKKGIADHESKLHQFVRKHCFSKKFETILCRDTQGNTHTYHLIIFYGYSILPMVHINFYNEQFELVQQL